MTSENRQLSLGTILFKGFELLDTFGPLELLLMDKTSFAPVMLAEEAGRVVSSQGPAAIADLALADCTGVDVLLVPGGRGVRHGIRNTKFLDELRRLAESAKYVCSVCTGSVLLAEAGLLEGRRATSNKAAWRWVIQHGKNVSWVPQARWVEDGTYFTASGVSAGMDMALALMARIHGVGKAREIAKLAEYSWQEDADFDPFAVEHGLTGT